MMNSRILRVGTGIAFALTAAACNSDKLTDLNKNPNSPEDVPPGPLFTNAARLSTARWLGSGYDLRQTEWVAQHLAEVQYNDEDRYLRLHSGDTEGNFNNAYTGELKDLAQVITKGTATTQPGVYAPALALRTWGFSYLTNTWGDVPYFTALAADAGGTLSPAYDKQKDIYDDFFKALAKASTDLTGASNVLSTADPIYSGSVTKWQKFSNSLRLRLALTLGRDWGQAGDLIQQVDDPTRCMLVEVFRDAEAPAKHRESAHFKAWLAAVTEGDMLVEPRTRQQYTNVFPNDTGWDLPPGARA